MKQITSRWNLPRAIRLALGIIAGVQGAITGQWVLLAAGCIITAMAIFNAGCCGASGCNIPPEKSK